jgi:hypothetical protein
MSPCTLFVDALIRDSREHVKEELRCIMPRILADVAEMEPQEADERAIGDLFAAFGTVTADEYGS